MAQANIRHSPSEIYDPKQRAIGAIVLILLMILLYAVLKAILGISGGTAYALRAPLPDEIKNSSQPIDSSSDPNSKFKYPLINRFVFLDLNGKPMSSNSETATTTMDDEDDDENSEEETNNTSKKPEKGAWYVQVASGKDKERAEKLANELTEKKFPAEVIKSGEWYRIRLKPQDSKEAAEQQLSKLKKERGLKGQLRKVK
jgi:cell division septation protein DedD